MGLFTQTRRAKRIGSTANGFTNHTKISPATARFPIGIRRRERKQRAICRRMVGNHPRSEDHKDHSPQGHRFLQLTHRSDTQNHEAVYTKARSTKLPAAYKWIARAYSGLLRHQTTRKLKWIYTNGSILAKIPLTLHGLHTANKNRESSTSYPKQSSGMQKL